VPLFYKKQIVLIIKHLIIMNVPENLKYTREHEWILTEGEVAKVGITDFAQSELGEIVIVDIATEGETLEAETVFGSIEAVKTVSDLFMPVGGEILEVNPALETQPELVNSDPYGKGWMIKIKMSDSTELNGLLSADDYKEIVE
jgi:glycine cleavage system H protein